MMHNDIATGIHNGHNTHHHDQAITLVSFNTINTISNGVAIDADWFTVLTVDFIYLLFSLYIDLYSLSICLLHVNLSPLVFSILHLTLFTFVMVNTSP